jgi:hypothetical protein
MSIIPALRKMVSFSLWYIERPRLKFEKEKRKRKHGEDYKAMSKFSCRQLRTAEV